MKLLKTYCQRKQNYQTHLEHLKLKGLQPKTIEAYSPAMRRIGAYFDYQISKIVFPEQCPWMLEQITDDTFYPS